MFTRRRLILEGAATAFALSTLGLQDIARAAQPSPGAKGRLAALTAAYNGSAQELFASLSVAPGNIVLSPYSIGTAMAMALAGARGNTATEMAHALMQSLGPSEINAANKQALGVLAGYNHSAGDDAAPPMRLSIANALALTRHEFPKSDAYISLLKSNYASELLELVGPDEINAWVSRKTEGKIDKLIDSLDPNTRMVLLNAIYFKAQRDEPFSERATRDDNFNLTPSRTARVPMMVSQREYALIATAGYRAIRLPYSAEDLGMIVVLPDRIDGLSATARSLGAAEVIPPVKTTDSRSGLVPRASR